jgi:hypothetical protein
MFVYSKFVCSFILNNHLFFIQKVSNQKAKKTFNDNTVLLFVILNVMRNRIFYVDKKTSLLENHNYH